MSENNGTGPRGPVTEHAPMGGGHGSTRTWTRTLGGTPYSFTAVLMPNGERRYFVSRYNGYGDDGTEQGRESGMRFGCAWSPAGEWIFTPERLERVALVWEAKDLIKTADRHGLNVRRSDFRVFDGALTLDGMDPLEWIETVSGVHEETDQDGYRVLVEND